MTTILVPPGSLAQYLSDEDLKDVVLELEDGDHPLPVDIALVTRVVVRGGPAARVVDPISLPDPGARVTIRQTSRLRFEGCTWATEKILYVVDGDKVEFASVAFEPQVRIQAGNNGDIWLIACDCEAQVLRARNGGSFFISNVNLQNLVVERNCVLRYSGINDVQSLAIARAAVFSSAETDVINNMHIDSQDLTLA